MSAKRKSFTALAKPVVRQSPKVATRSRIDESKASVTAGLTPKSALKRATHVDEEASDSPSPSADNDDEKDEDSENEQQSGSKPLSLKLRKAGREATAQKPSQVADADAEMTSPKPDEAQEAGDASDAEPPTFGDLMRGSSTIDVSSSLAAQASNNAAARAAEAQPRSLVPVSSTSLGTVLNQALKSDDRDLLESCLQVSDTKIVQNTINRMDSSLAVVLLSKLADRMHRRPGRAFGLMKWIQLTLIAHGGTLVRHPELASKLEKLSRVLEERSRGLNSLLALKGKLDMLDQQMQHRRAIKNARSEGSDEEGSEDVDEPGVVYVEGQDNEEVKALTNGTGGRGGDDDDDFGGANGLIGDSDDESEEEDDNDDLADDLAEVESLDEDDVDHDDVEEESGDEEEEDQDDEEDNAPPSKVQKTSKFGKRK